MAKSKALMMGLPFYLAFEGEGNMGHFRSEGYPQAFGMRNALMSHRLRVSLDAGREALGTRRSRASFSAASIQGVHHCTNPRTRGEADHASFGLMIAISGPWPRLST
jgi:hypothetical protein